MSNWLRRWPSQDGPSDLCDREVGRKQPSLIPQKRALEQDSSHASRKIDKCYSYVFHPRVPVKSGTIAETFPRMKENRMIRFFSLLPALILLGFASLSPSAAQSIPPPNSNAGPAPAARENVEIQLQKSAIEGNLPLTLNGAVEL